MRKAFGTPYEFRKTKRMQVREAEQAIHQLMMGSAFTPAGKEITDAWRAITAAREKLKVKNFKKML